MTPEEARILLSQAEAAFAAGDRARARALVESIVAERPGDTGALAFLGELLRPVDSVYPGTPPPEPQAAPPGASRTVVEPFARWYGEGIVVSFEWPAAEVGVRLAVCEGHDRLDVREALREAQPVPLARFQEAGGVLRVPTVPSTPSVWVCLFDGEQGVPLGTLRLHRPPAPILWRMEKETTFWGKVVARRLRFCWTQAGTVPDVRVRASTERLPLRPSDGDEWFSIPSLDLHDGQSVVPVPLTPRAAWVRIFAGADSSAWFLAERGGGWVAT